MAYLIAALRHEDQVIAVMPFNRHQDFRVCCRVISSNAYRCVADLGIVV